MNKKELLDEMAGSIPRSLIPRQELSTFLKSAGHQYNSVALRDIFPRNLGREIEEMISAPRINQTLLHSIEQSRRQFEKALLEVRVSDEFIQNLSSIPNAIAKTLQSADLAIHKTLNLPDISHEATLSMQRACQAAQVAVNFNYDGLSRVWEKFDSVARSAELFSSVLPRNLHQVILKTLNSNRLWQSDILKEFSKRMVLDSDLRTQVFEQFETGDILDDLELQNMTASPDAVLEAVERGISESGILQSQDNVQSAIEKMFLVWEGLPKDLRSFCKEFSAAFTAGFFLLIVEYYVFVSGEQTFQMPIKQRVQLVEKVTNNIFINLGTSNDDRNQYRIVTKDQLPLFNSRRRDSCVIGILPAGQVVTVRFKRRNWTQIEWKDHNTKETLTGWVYTRYLRKFRYQNQ